jgi:hypothetical protein
VIQPPSLCDPAAPNGPFRKGAATSGS